MSNTSTSPASNRCSIVGHSSLLLELIVSALTPMRIAASIWLRIRERSGETRRVHPLPRSRKSRVPRKYTMLLPQPVFCTTNCRLFCKRPSMESHCPGLKLASGRSRAIRKYLSAASFIAPLTHSTPCSEPNSECLPPAHPATGAPSSRTPATVAAHDPSASRPTRLPRQFSRLAHADNRNAQLCYDRSRRGLRLIKNYPGLVPDSNRALGELVGGDGAGTVERDLPNARRQRDFGADGVGGIGDHAHLFPRFTLDPAAVDGEHQHVRVAGVVELQPRANLFLGVQTEDGVRFAQRDDVARVGEEVEVLLFERPIDLVDVVRRVVTVLVAFLRAGEFLATVKKRHALRGEQQQITELHHVFQFLFRRAGLGELELVPHDPVVVATQVIDDLVGPVGPEPPASLDRALQVVAARTILHETAVRFVERRTDRGVAEIVVERADARAGDGLLVGRMHRRLLAATAPRL